MIVAYLAQNVKPGRLNACLLGGVQKDFETMPRVCRPLRGFEVLPASLDGEASLTAVRLGYIRTKKDGLRG